jgi:hypothetical protein
MLTIRRWRSLVMLLPLTVLTGVLLSGCHGGEEAKPSGDYYTGPLKGKGTTSTDDTTGKAKGNNP